MTDSDKTPGPQTQKVDHAGNAAELARDIQQFQRRGPEGLVDQIATLVDLEERAIDLAAMSEDGLVRTLSAGAILAVLEHWERLCRRLGGEQSVASCREVVRAAIGDSTSTTLFEVSCRACSCRST